MWPFKKSVLKPPEKQTEHHYVLAHVVLRQVAQRDPYIFFGMLRSPRRKKFLNDIWKHVYEHCDEEGKAYFSSQDVLIHPRNIGEYPAVLIEMPPPYFTMEAYMVCAVLGVPPSEAVKKMPDNPKVYYYTLEKGVDLAGGH